MLSNEYQYDGKEHPDFLTKDPIQKIFRDQIQRKIDSKEYEYKNTPCPICNSTNFELLGSKDRYGIYFPWGICKSCGLMQTFPKLEPRSIESFYKHEYRNLHKGQDGACLRRPELQMQRGHTLIEFLTSKSMMPEAGSLILEIGCSSGGVLKSFEEKGYRVIGTDLDHEHVNYGKENFNLDLRIGPARELKLDEKPALIIYSHVLEHVSDLNGELKDIRGLMNEKTILYVEVPGTYDFKNRKHQDIIKHIDFAHLFYFTAGTLSNLMKKSNFKELYKDEEVRSIWKLEEHRDSQFTYNNEYPRTIKFIRRFYHLNNAAKTLSLLLPKGELQKKTRNKVRKLLQNLLL